MACLTLLVDSEFMARKTYPDRGHPSRFSPSAGYRPLSYKPISYKPIPYKLSATSSGCRQPWPVLAGADGLTPGLGLTDPDVSGEVAKVGPGVAVGVGVELAGAEGGGWVRELGASPA